MSTLSSTETFRDSFGIPSSSWQAIFIMVAVISAIVAIWQLIVVAVRLMRGKFWSKDVVRVRFFSEERKMNNRGTKTKKN